MLPIFEDGIKGVQALPRQQTNGSDQAANTSCSKRASRKSNQDDLIALIVVLLSRQPYP
jgi:hypothetical protein